MIMGPIGAEEMRRACDRFWRKRGQPVMGMGEVASAETRARQEAAAQRQRRNSVERAARDIERRSRG